MHKGSVVLAKLGEHSGHVEVDVRWIHQRNTRRTLPGIRGPMALSSSNVHVGQQGNSLLEKFEGALQVLPALEKTA
jgi:hypothetical protein